MKYSFLLAFGLLLIVSVGCDRNRSKELSGTLYLGFEAFYLVLDEYNEPVWISDPENILEDVYALNRERLDRENSDRITMGKYNIVITGKLSDKGSHGHLGGFEKEGLVKNQWVN